MSTFTCTASHSDSAPYPDEGGSTWLHTNPSAPLLSLTHTGSIERDLFSNIPPNPSLISGYSASMFFCQLCKREKFPAETLARDGRDTAGVSKAPKVFSLSWLWNYDLPQPPPQPPLWAAESKFKRPLNVTYGHGLVTVLLLCCIYM